MDELYGRVVQMLIGPKGKDGRLITDLRMTFEVEKSLESNPNTAKLEIYNLSEASRTAIEQEGSIVSINAGYGTKPKTVFVGDVAYVTTKRNGADIISIVECGDGEDSFKNSSLDISFGEGTSVSGVVDSLVGAFGFAKGAISGVDGGGEYQNGAAFSGLIRDHMDAVVRDKLGLNWSIQDGKIQILPESSGTDEGIIILNPQTGLIGSPFRKKVVNDSILKGKKQESGIELLSLLNADFRPGRIIQIESAQIKKGFYKIEKVKHKGDTHGKDFYSTLEAKAL